MRKKIIGIVILMLVATTVVSATQVDVTKTIETKPSGEMSRWKTNNQASSEPALFDWWCVDQKQTTQNGYGITLIPPETLAQSFTPTKNKLTAVALYIFRAGSPEEPVHITVSIRDNLTGPDLAIKTIDTSEVSISTATWVVFDFDDITITPGIKYYIVGSGDAGDATNAYCWLFASTDVYSAGEAWHKATAGSSWIKWSSGTNNPADFCFKTYFRKPIDVSSVPNNFGEIAPTSYEVDAPVWEVGDSWTYNEQYLNNMYKADGSLWYQWYHNCTSTYTVTDATGDNYTVTMTSTNNEGRVRIGSFHLKFTKSTKFTREIILRKSDLATISDSWQEKGLVFWLLGNIIPLPAQYTDVWGGTYTPPDVILPFPFSVGSHGTLPNATYSGHEKCTLYWGLITLYNWPEVLGYTGEQNYTCEMAPITVPAGSYDTYNVSSEATYGLGQSLRWSYYAPEAGWIVKQTIDSDQDPSGHPGFIFDCELVSTTYTP